MRLLLITISVLAASSTSAATGFLDKTPAEAYDDLSPWLESSLDQLFDDRITLGDIIIGFVGLGIGGVVIKIIGTIRRQARQALNIRGLKTGIIIIIVVFFIILLIMFLI